MPIIPFFSICCFIIQLSNGAKILGVFHFPSKSHHILGSSLLKALALKGHEVTMLSPFPDNVTIKNYEHITMAGFLEKTKANFKTLMQEEKKQTFLNVLLLTVHKMDWLSKEFFENESVKNLLASKRKFDLLLLVWSCNESFLSLAHHFNAVSVVMNTVGSGLTTNYVTRNPAPYSYIPNMYHLPYDMNLWDRTQNLVYGVLVETFNYFVQVKHQERVRKKYFPNGPSVYDLISNISLVFLNSHISLEHSKPYVPNMIPIGGFHVEEPKQLEGDLKEFLDSATEGAIFFSLGSNLKSSDFSGEIVRGILKTFSKLPQKVLWKFESAELLELPPNVKIGKWLPQNDILAHRNIKLFISHGGLLSTTEAVYHGVPIIGIPFYGDQGPNIIDSVKNGYAINLKYKELSEETLTGAINEMLRNQSYFNNIQQRSKILRDQPIKPIDNAVFWMEYVLRHKGAHHLKTGALNLTWYQHYLLDVFGLLLLIIAFTFMVSSFIVSSFSILVSSVILKGRKILKLKQL